MEPLRDDFRLVGDRIYLRPITENDTDMVLKWRNAPYVVDNFFYRIPITKEEHLNWLRSKVNKGLVYQFIVCLLDDTPIGVVYLQHYDASEASMESGVFFDERMPQGIGLGTEAVKLMNFDFAFRTLKLTKTYARVLGSNIASLKLHEKVGFKVILRDKEKIVPNDIFEEAVTFELLNNQ